MTKQEFLDTLRRSLARELSEPEVADNINYYWNYIEEQIASGKSEEQVLRELGDPRLIAKTILQVDQCREEEEGAYSQETVYTEGADGAYESDGESYRDMQFGNTHIHVHGATWKTWLTLIVVIFVIFLILGTVFTILWKLLPFLLVGAAVIWVYHRITGQ